ncbi:MAG: polysaccharide biosynthesis/export family protein [Muribaculaceae bacterium]|nr:polysaccharide biosynthesis/export family protein [Muribaculaceae bacterium]
MKSKLVYFVIAALSLLTSCRAPQNVTYFKDVDEITLEQLQAANQRVDPVLVPGDLLNIRVYAPNMASVVQFNKGMIVNMEGQVSMLQNTASNNFTNRVESSTDYYLINSDGQIDFPVLGMITAAGKTKEQLADEILHMIYPKYVNTAPTVDVRLMNFRVTVLGQVKNAGVVTSTNERMNVLEAIALAGDLDIKGQRDNVLLYRTNADGSREIHRLNLNDRDILLSPYFNLQQNDFIYVEPNKSAKQNAWQVPPGLSVGISVIGGVSSIASLVVGIINLTQK